MKRNILLVMVLLALAVFSAACAAQEVSGASDDATSEPVASSDGGVEDQASLMEALRAAGAQVEAGDSVEQPFFTVMGQILKVDGADVQFFEYESAEAMEAEAALVSADGGSVGTSMMMWMATPHFFKSGRVLVLYVGDDAAVLDLLKGTLDNQFAGR